MTTTPWSAEWSDGSPARATETEARAGGPTTGGWTEFEDRTGPEDWTERAGWAVSERWAPSDQYPLSDQGAEQEDLAGLDESHAVGAEELDAEELEQSWEGGLALLPELLAVETGAVAGAARVAGLAAFAAGPNLRRGSTGPAVAALQRVLTDVGHPVAADGDFGPRTDAAVRAFQARAGPTADGIVDPNTKAALTAALGNHPPGPGPTLTPPDRAV